MKVKLDDDQIDRVIKKQMVYHLRYLLDPEDAEVIIEGLNE
jgi:hypothetical protein